VNTYEELELAIRARVPLIALVTPEEARAEERLLKPLAAEWREGRLLAWTTTAVYRAGLRDGRGAGHLPCAGPLSALTWCGLRASCALRPQDFHHYIENAPLLRRCGTGARPARNRQARDLPRAPVPGARGPGKEVQVLDYPPPELKSCPLSSTRSSHRSGTRRGGGPSSRKAGATAQGGLGLTLAEAEAVLAKRWSAMALTDAGVDLSSPKRSRSSGAAACSSITRPQMSWTTSAGWRLSKNAARRRQAFTRTRGATGWRSPRGPAAWSARCGKSLVARSISRSGRCRSCAWTWPDLRRYIGESEAAIRSAIRTRRRSPLRCSGSTRSRRVCRRHCRAHDTGVSARVLGTFLTWMQEKQKPVFVVATANQIRNCLRSCSARAVSTSCSSWTCPVRKSGRDIPVHSRRRRDPAPTTSPAGREDRGVHGREIEQVVNEALYAAYAAGPGPWRRKTWSGGKRGIPIAVTMKERSLRCATGGHSRPARVMRRLRSPFRGSWRAETAGV